MNRFIEGFTFLSSIHYTKPNLSRSADTSVEDVLASWDKASGRSPRVLLASNKD